MARRRSFTAYIPIPSVQVVPSLWSYDFEGAGDVNSLFSANGGVPTGFLANTDVIGDWSISAYVATGRSPSAKAMRIATGLEYGGASNIYRVGVRFKPAAISALGLTSGRAVYDLKIPTGGIGVSKSRSDWHTFSFFFLYEYTTGTGILVGFSSATTIGAWNFVGGGYRAPDFSWDVTGHTDLGWHTFSVTWKLGASGYVILGWDGASSTKYSFSLSPPNPAIFMTTSIGDTYNNTDVNYFGAMDNIFIYSS